MAARSVGKGDVGVDVGRGAGVGVCVDADKGTAVGVNAGVRAGSDATLLCVFCVIAAWGGGCVCDVLNART